MELWQLTGLLVTVAAVVVVNIVRDYRDPYSYRRLSQTIRQMAYEQSLAAVRIVELETLVAEFEAGHEMNARRMEQKGVALVWRPTRTARSIANGGARLLPLYELLFERFSDDEMFDLAFRVGIKRDEIEGDTHSARAQSLIEYVARHELVDELLAAGREVRPELEWPGNVEG